MKRQKLRLAVPLILSIFIALFAIGWSFTFKEVPPILIRGFQPAAFPRIIAGLIVILSALALFNLMKGTSEVAPEPLPNPFRLSLIALAIFAVLLAVGDFLFALMVGTAGLSFMWGERRPLVLLGLGIVAPVLVLLLFDLAFQVRFPRGFLIDLYYG